MTDTKNCILIVDDAPENIDMLRGLLGNEYKIKVALNGKKALELAKKAPQPDLVLLDIVMPEMDGYEVLKTMKSDPELEHLSVIFLTSKVDPEDEKKGFALGAIDYITKPFDPDIVISRIRPKIEMSVNQKKLREQLSQLQNQTIESGDTEKEWLEVIAKGESETSEFKSTLRFNLYTKKHESRIENQCLKSVAAFLNGNGGTLFVGVNDDGEPIGMKPDAFKNEDKLMLHWHNLVREYIGADMAQFIHTKVVDLKGEQVLIIQCDPSSRPVFMTRDGDEAFYVRMGNSSQSLKPSEMLAYVDSRYGTAR